MATTIAQRIRSRMERERLDADVRKRIAGGESPRDVLERLSSDEVAGLVSFHGLFSRRTKAEAVEGLCSEVYGRTAGMKWEDKKSQWAQQGWEVK